MHWEGGDSVGRGTTLQAGRQRVRIPIVSLEFFIDTILPVLGLTKPVTVMGTRNISFRVKAAGT